MHFELPGLAMNSHFGSVGSSAAALGSASAVNASSASATDANVRPPRLTPCRIVAPPLLALGWCCRHLQRRGTPPAPRFIYSGKKLLSIRNRNLFQGRACKAGFPRTLRCPSLWDALPREHVSLAVV